MNDPIPSPQFDYIILGAGCSGLSLAIKMLESGLLDGKKLLIVDKSEKNENDRTWCFWESGNGYFESIVHHSYDELLVYHSSLKLDLSIAPYRYKMLRGLEFYNYCKKVLSESSQVTFRIGEIRMDDSDMVSKVFVNEQELDVTGSLVFNSIYTGAGQASLKLLQHFKGWIIKTEDPVFNPGKATLMDFRVSQSEGATFVYVLPLSEKRALVEYTLFTPCLLASEAYELGLKEYINRYITKSVYSIEETEWGVIPMNNEKLPFLQGGIYQLGMAGGQTKPSTGYTFQFIQKQTDFIVETLRYGKKLPKSYKSSHRFKFYDSVLLDLLIRKRPPGDKIFGRLFERNVASEVFRFLDNETNFFQELRLISSLPVWPFLKAAVRRMTSRR